MIKGYTCFVLPKAEKNKLLATIPFTHPNRIAHHITYEYGVTEQMPPTPSIVMIVGVIDKDGIQAIVASIDGTVKRPDGKIYHITWSLDPGKKAWESNTILSKYQYEKIDPIRIQVEPKFIPL